MIFRRPDEVVDSLRRRGDVALKHNFHGAWPLARLGFDMFRRAKAIDVWLAYNREIIRFADANPEYVRVLDLNRMAEAFPKLLRMMRTQWGFEVKDIDVREFMDAH